VLQDNAPLDLLIHAETNLAYLHHLQGVPNLCPLRPSHTKRNRIVQGTGPLQLVNRPLQAMAIVYPIERCSVRGREAKRSQTPGALFRGPRDPDRDPTHAGPATPKQPLQLS
jgi:hypothetical protein